jgi:nitrogenase molybdenum-iron protein alpha/beta subunit
MNDEPIAAWMRYREDGATVITTYQFEGGIPLYRHPYKATPLEQERLLMNADYVIGMMREEIEKLKTRSPLSDGEVTILANKYLKGIEIEYESAGVYEFAKAILREAQSK